MRADPGKEEILEQTLVLATNEPHRKIRAGEQCPRCGKGKMDYDGLLNLVCEACGYAGGESGCFT